MTMTTTSVDRDHGDKDDMRQDDRRDILSEHPGTETSPENAQNVGISCYGLEDRL